MRLYRQYRSRLSLQQHPEHSSLIRCGNGTDVVRVIPVRFRKRGESRVFQWKHETRQEEEDRNMTYILDERYRFRGWYKLPTGLFDTEKKTASFLPPEDYLLLLKCDGTQDLPEDTLSEKERNILRRLQEEKIIRPALPGDMLREDQLYKTYPARYRREVHWSVTGACNLKCRHCFMSAPKAKHGAPSLKEILDVADQMAECGIFQVGITGGEPLVRQDLLEL